MIRKPLFCHCRNITHPYPHKYRCNVSISLSWIIYYPHGNVCAVDMRASDVFIAQMLASEGPCDILEGGLNSLTIKLASPDPLDGK